MAQSWRGIIDRIERTSTRAGRMESGRSSLEGPRLHERALRAGVVVEAAVVARAFAGEARGAALLAELERAGCDVQLAPDDVLAALSGGRRSGAIMGLIPLPAPAPWERIASSSVLLAATDVEEPGNAGALQRTALALGASGFVAVGRTDPWHPKALRTSMGSSFKLAIHSCETVEALVAELRARGGATFAAVSRGGVSLPDWQRPAGPLAMLVGAESTGLPESARAAADGLLTVPMSSAVDSLSINAAAAILLYAASLPSAC